jgi:hypothetical protein
VEGIASRLEEVWAHFQVLCSSLIRSSPPYSIRQDDRASELNSAYEHLADNLVSLRTKVLEQELAVRFGFQQISLVGQRPLLFRARGEEVRTGHVDPFLQQCISMGGKIVGQVRGPDVYDNINGWSIDEEEIRGSRTMMMECSA